MRTKEFFCARLLLFAFLLCAFFQFNDSEAEQNKLNNCIFTLTVSRSSSPWLNYTSSAEEEQSSYLIRAVKIETGYETIPTIADITVQGRLLLAHGRARRRIVANQDYFSDLARPDATTIESGQRISIGIYRERSLDNQNLVRFLLKSELIRTYIHVESELCLKESKTTGSEYRAFITGEHIYFTNRRNVSPLSFEIVIDNEKKTMAIEGK